MEVIRKAMNERNLNEGQWEGRKQWSLVSDNVEKRSETEICNLYVSLKAKNMYKIEGFAKARWMSVIYHHAF
jgi:hypothetical protein